MHIFCISLQWFHSLHIICIMIIILLPCVTVDLQKSLKTVSRCNDDTDVMAIWVVDLAPCCSCIFRPNCAAHKFCSKIVWHRSAWSRVHTYILNHTCCDFVHTVDRKNWKWSHLTIQMFNISHFSYLAVITELAYPDMGALYNFSCAVLE